MKFRIEHRFSNISLADYEKLYFDEEFDTALCKAVQLTRTLIQGKTKNNHISRAVRVSVDREIPTPIAKILGADHLEYTEYLDYGFGSHHGRWKTVASLMASKIYSHGNFTFSANNSVVTRVVEGEIKVKIFAVGGVVEQFIVADIEKSYNRTAAFTQRWINDRSKIQA